MDRRLPRRPATASPAAMAASARRSGSIRSDRTTQGWKPGPRPGVQRMRYRIPSLPSLACLLRPRQVGEAPAFAGVSSFLVPAAVAGRNCGPAVPLGRR
jgi:hypothetical protein